MSSKLLIPTLLFLITELAGLDLLYFQTHYSQINVAEALESPTPATVPDSSGTDLPTTSNTCSTDEDDPIVPPNCH